MSKKKLELRFRRGWYENSSGQISVCASSFEDYFDLKKEDCVVYVSSEEPKRGTNYYTLGRKSLNFDTWRFVDGPDKRRSPWPGDFDAWLNERFPKSTCVYVWVLA